MPAPHVQIRIPRQDSLASWAGLVTGALVLSVLASASFWTVYSHREEARRGRQAEVRAVARLLGASVESFLASDDVSSVRRLVGEVAREHGLRVCRVSLADGSIIADRNAKTPVKALPGTWPGGADVGDGPHERVDGSAVSIDVPLTAPGKGLLRLRVEADAAVPAFATPMVQAGLGVIGVGAMAGLALACRAIRRRTRAIGAIRGALLDARAGEASAAALAVSAELGPDAEAWNELLAELERLRGERLRERAAEQRAPREADAGAACDAMWLGVVVVDDALRARYANGAAAVFLGARREAMVGADVSGLIESPAVVDALRSALAGKVRHRVAHEVARTTPGGASVMRMSVRPLRREESGGAMLVIEDVTQQRAADQARNAFVAQATHELRTPLTNFRLYLEQLVDAGDGDTAARARCINVLTQESRWLERVVADMLSVAEIEAGALKLRVDDVRLETVFEELEADYGPQAQDKEITLAFALPPKLPVLQGDRDKIVLTLHNLIGNALKYTPKGGTVLVAVDAGAASAGTLVVDVKDSGIGIREEEQGLIFERFYRAKDPRLSSITGSGLGLALAREVARLHGGDITVSSELDKGSTFRLSLPARAKAA